jgi:hypothetical protein
MGPRKCRVVPAVQVGSHEIEVAQDNAGVLSSAEDDAGLVPGTENAKERTRGDLGDGDILMMNFASVPWKTPVVAMLISESGH